MAGQLQMLAAIGAALRMRQAKRAADPAAQPRLLAAVGAALPGGIDNLDEQQVSEALAYVTLQIEDAADLFHNVERPPGWVVQDPAILQAQGQGSRHNIRCLVALAKGSANIGGVARRPFSRCRDGRRSDGA